MHIVSQKREQWLTHLASPEFSLHDAIPATSLAPKFDFTSLAWYRFQGIRTFYIRLELLTENKKGNNASWVVRQTSSLDPILYALLVSFYILEQSRRFCSWRYMLKYLKCLGVCKLPSVVEWKKVMYTEKQRLWWRMKKQIWRCIDIWWIWVKGR